MEFNTTSNTNTIVDNSNCSLSQVTVLSLAQSSCGTSCDTDQSRIYAFSTDNDKQDLKGATIACNTIQLHTYISNREVPSYLSTFHDSDISFPELVKIVVESTNVTELGACNVEQFLTDVLTEILLARPNTRIFPDQLKVTPKSIKDAVLKHASKYSSAPVMTWTLIISFILGNMKLVTSVLRTMTLYVKKPIKVDENLDSLSKMLENYAQTDIISNWLTLVKGYDFGVTSVSEIAMVVQQMLVKALRTQLSFDPESVVDTTLKSVMGAVSNQTGSEYGIALTTFFKKHEVQALVANFSILRLAIANTPKFGVEDATTFSIPDAEICVALFTKALNTQAKVMTLANYPSKFAVRTINHQKKLSMINETICSLPSRLIVGQNFIQNSLAMRKVSKDQPSCSPLYRGERTSDIMLTTVLNKTVGVFGDKHLNMMTGLLQQVEELTQTATTFNLYTVGVSDVDLDIFAAALMNNVLLYEDGATGNISGLEMIWSLAGHKIINGLDPETLFTKDPMVIIVLKAKDSNMPEPVVIDVMTSHKRAEGELVDFANTYDQSKLAQRSITHKFKILEKEYSIDFKFKDIFARCETSDIGYHISDLLLSTLASLNSQKNLVTKLVDCELLNKADDVEFDELYIKRLAKYNTDQLVINFADELKKTSPGEYLINQVLNQVFVKMKAVNPDLFKNDYFPMEVRRTLVAETILLNALLGL